MIQQVAPPPPYEPIRDALYYFEKLKRANVPPFEGKSDPDMAEKWLDEVENCFELNGAPDN